MHQDTVTHTRVVYTFWDFLSDIGGLFDSLKYIVIPIISLVHAVLGNQLDRYLISRLLKFEVERPDRQRRQRVQ